MHTRSVTDPNEFLELLTELAGEVEARHNLMFGIAGSLVAAPDVYEDFRLWVADESGRPVGAALITPPWQLVISDEAVPGAATSLAEAVHENSVEVPGVVGNKPAIEHFLSAWTGLDENCTIELGMAQGVFALEKVRPVPQAPGTARPAKTTDRQMLIDWIKAFKREAFATPPPGDTVDLVDRMLPGRGSELWLWEDRGRPVALSGYGRPTPSGMRIGPVYTPPEHRRKGYATSLVAEQSQWLLDQGHRFCFLYTNLADATSNAIYERIGYEQVAEAAQYRFVR